MTPGHQCLSTDSESNWEDVESDVESEDWAEEFTNSIRRFHGLNPDSSQGGVVGKSDREDVEDERDERDLAKAEEGERESRSRSKSKSVGTVMGSFPRTTSVIRNCDIFDISYCLNRNC